MTAHESVDGLSWLLAPHTDDLKLCEFEVCTMPVK